MGIWETNIHSTKIPGAPWLCQAVCQALGALGDTAEKSRARLPDAGRARFCSPTPGPTKEGPLSCLLARVSRPPSKQAHVPSQLSFLPLHLKIESNNQNLHGLQNAPCPHRKCQPTQHGQHFVFSVPSGPGLPLQHFWQVLVLAAQNSEHLAARNESVAIWKGLGRSHTE